MSFQNFQTECIEIATIQPGFEAEGRRLGMQPGDRFPDVFTMAWEYAALYPIPRGLPLGLELEL